MFEPLKQQNIEVLLLLKSVNMWICVGYFIEHKQLNLQWIALKILNLPTINCSLFSGEKTFNVKMSSFFLQRYILCTRQCDNYLGP